jgi:transcriptional repressor of dcmA and dcmR
MLNTAEAARFLRVSQASIRRWADSGRLRASRVGGRRERRFKESDLVAFLGGQPPSVTAGRGITVGGAAVPVPGHVAVYYTTDEGGLRLTVPFLAEGLRLGQPCVLVATEPTVSRYVAAIGDGAAGLTTAAFKGGTAAAAIAEWEERFADLVARGADVVRVVGEMSCEREMFVSEEEMLRYEEAVELMSKRYPVVVLCQYDARVFSGLAVVRSAKAHPDMFAFRVGAFLN